MEPVSETNQTSTPIAKPAREPRAPNMGTGPNLAVSLVFQRGIIPMAQGGLWTCRKVEHFSCDDLASSQATHPMSQAQVEQSLTFVPWAWANRDLNKHGVRPFTASRGKSALPVNLEHLPIAWPKSIRKECKSQAQASLLPFRFSCEWGL